MGVCRLLTMQHKSLSKTHPHNHRMDILTRLNAYFKHFLCHPVVIFPYTFIGTNNPFRSVQVSFMLSVSFHKNGAQSADSFL